MNTRALNALADVICRAQKLDRTPMGIAFAIDTAGMHQSPESADEQVALLKDRDAFREQRNAVFKTNVELLARVQQADLARVVAENEGRAMAREVERLTARVARLRQERHSTNEVLAASEVSVAAALALHTQYPDSGHCQHDGERWPCPTTRALRSRAEDVSPHRQAEDPYVEAPVYRSVMLPASAALCTCGHTGADHHHAESACWAHLPRGREPGGVWDSIKLCDCRKFVASFEDPHDSDLHRDYALGHDLPEVTP